MHKWCPLILLLFSFLQLTTASGQGLESWMVYSSYSTINDMDVSEDGTVYAATLGGLFTVENNEISATYTTVDGLYRPDPSHVVFDDATGRLIIAFTDGIINIMNRENDQFEQIDDIFRVNEFNSKRINDLLIHNDELYVATDFGMVVFDLTNFLVQNSYLKLGEFSRGTPVNGLDISNGLIYCSTNEGVAIADLSSNLIDNSVWTNYDSNDGLLSDMVMDITHFSGQTYALSEDSAHVLNGMVWETTQEFGTGGIESFERSGEGLAVLFSNKVFIRKNDLTETNYFIPNGNTLMSVSLVNGSYFTGTLSAGIFEFNGSGEVTGQYIPDGPYINFFSRLSLSDARLVATTLEAFPGAGDPFAVIRSYSILNEDGWANYNRTSTPELINFWAAYTVSANESSFYIGSWGRGLVRHNKETNEINHYTASNSGFTGIPNDRNYVVVTGLASDSQENMWAVSYLSNLPLNVQQSGSDDWLHFPKEAISSADQYYDLFIDSNDQKWITLINIEGNGRGLLVLDTNSPEDPSDDEFRKLNTGINNGNLPDENVKAIIEDKNGEIWVGTGRGIARFIFPDFIVQSNNPNEYRAQWLINEDTSAVSRFLLRDVNVSAMAVNAANEKWIGSVNQGIWVVNEEGSRIIKRFTTENSPLISNNINSITIDDETGEVFISTEKGLISYTDIPKAPVQKMDQLKVFPNPFVYSKHEQVIIEGLGEATEVKVLGVDGKIVNTLTARGGRTSWNGLDFNGKQLGTGVYIIVALESDGSDKGIGKVVIVK